MATPSTDVSLKTKTGNQVDFLTPRNHEATPASNGAEGGSSPVKKN